MWENRWDESEEKLGSSCTEALKKLYDFYGDNIYKWFARLYEPEIGAFYYSNSARDHEGFLPDIESTTQCTEMVAGTGMAVGYDVTNMGLALPDDIRLKIMHFAQSLQDEEDGFFYHKQWGKSIYAARKGRDINSSIGVIRRMGGEPLYKTALERLREAPREDMNKVSSVPEYMTDIAKLDEYLATLNVNYDSHSVGHTLESQGSQFKATGVIDHVCDWLDAHQLESGLWQPVTDRPYTALSGLLKIGSFYNIAGRQMRYCDKMVDAAIDIILCDEDPVFVILVYNPWGGLRYAFLNMKRANATAEERGEPLPYDIDAAREKVKARLPEMIDKTVEKLAKFRKPDGSFSYCQKFSSPHTQGTPVSLGVYEGDVNGTALAMNTMSGTIFEVLGIARVPLYSPADFEEFVRILKEQKVPEKKPVPADNPSFKAHLSIVPKVLENVFKEP